MSGQGWRGSNVVSASEAAKLSVISRAQARRRRILHLVGGLDPADAFASGVRVALEFAEKRAAGKRLGELDALVREALAE